MVHGSASLQHFELILLFRGKFVFKGPEPSSDSVSVRSVSSLGGQLLLKEDITHNSSFSLRKKII